MTTMLEKAARATYAKWIEDVRDLEPAWDDLPESHRARLIDASRAALLAIREPDNRMENAGVSKMHLGADEGEATAIWQAMIDAILSEGEA